MALVAIPLIVHLIARSKPPVRKFSSIAFLHKIIKKSSRYQKPKDRLVLILRTLAAAALLFAFVQPLLVSKNGGLNGNDKTVIFVIDQSASMAASENASSRFTIACDEASALLSEIEPDSANIIWINATPTAVFPSPGPNIDYLTQELQKATHTPEQGSISAAIQLAIDQLQDTKGEREIVVISDFQKEPWENTEIFIPESIKLTKLAVGEVNLPNIAITSLAAFPASPVSGQTVAISTQVRNFSDQVTSTTIYLNAGGGRQSAQIEIPANGQTETEFITQFSHSGEVTVSASITEDSYREDDQRHTIIPIREQLKIVSLTKSQSSPHSQILDRLATALTWLNHSQTQQLPAIGVVDVLFIHQWDGDNIEQLTELSNTGTSIIVTPSTKCKLPALQQLLDLTPIDTSLNLRSDPQGWTAATSKESSQIFSIFKSGEFGNPAQGTFRQRFELPKVWGNASLISYNDGIPAIILSKKQHASRLIWNLTYDPAHSDWISQEPFVTFMAELLLSIQPSKFTSDNELISGSPLNWILPENIDAQNLKLKTGQGDELPTEILNTAQGASIQSLSPATPGIYNWQTGANTIKTHFVNFPSSESDLTLMKADQIPTGESAKKDDILRAEALSQGIPMWPWLVGATFLFLIAESFTASTKKQIS